MNFFLKRALNDMSSNRGLHAITIITITLSILIVSAFFLFFVNVSSIMEPWKKGIRIMAYLNSDAEEQQVEELKGRLLKLYGVREARFISKDQALNMLQTHMKRQMSLFENLHGNPLPDAFEIRMIAETQSWEQVETLAAEIESLSLIDTVEYGQRWLGRFKGVFNLFKFAGFFMCAVFFMATVFIVANTIRLLFYSRIEEFEIMLLVGASENFVKAPFYIGGMIQGVIGGILGIVILFIIYLFASSSFEPGVSASMFEIRFLSLKTLMGIILCSSFAGWLGCFFSLKQLRIK